MLKKLVVFGAISVCAVGVVPSMAQEVATLVLKDGQRVSCELIDMNASGFAVRVNGQGRSIGAGDVAVVEFTQSAPPADAQARLNAGQQFVVLRNGQTIEGRLSDVGGTHPLRLTIDTPGGQRDISSSDVAQVYLANPGGRAPATSTQAAPPAPGAITVAANQPWTDAGMSVGRGERIRFTGAGDIMVATGASSGVGGSPIAPGGPLPVAGAGVGSLIGRVGTGAPFLIGANTGPIVMPTSGRLFLGVNDDHFGDNTGSFTVSIARVAR